MGPLSLFLIRQWRPAHADDPVRGTPALQPAGRYTVVQIKCLKGLKKGNIAVESPGTLTLHKGTDSTGELLHRYKYNPLRVKSWRNAQLICEEVARLTYRMELLFIDTPVESNNVRVLCPQCQGYWRWHEPAGCSLKSTEGRLCPACRSSLTE